MEPNKKGIIILPSLSHHPSCVSPRPYRGSQGHLSPCPPRVSAVFSTSELCFQLSRAFLSLSFFLTELTLPLHPDSIINTSPGRGIVLHLKSKYCRQTLLDLLAWLGENQHTQEKSEKSKNKGKGTLMNSQMCWKPVKSWV